MPLDEQLEECRKRRSWDLAVLSGEVQSNKWPPWWSVRLPMAEPQSAVAHCSRLDRQSHKIKKYHRSRLFCVCSERNMEVVMVIAQVSPSLLSFANRAVWLCLRVWLRALTRSAFTLDNRQTRPQQRRRRQRQLVSNLRRNNLLTRGILLQEYSMLEVGIAGENVHTMCLATKTIVLLVGPCSCVCSENNGDRAQHHRKSQHGCACCLPSLPTLLFVDECVDNDQLFPFSFPFSFTSLELAGRLDLYHGLRLLEPCPTLYSRHAAV